MNSSQSLHKAYEQLMGRSLTPEQVAEIKFNLVKYIETLIQMDKQRNERLKQHITEVNKGRKA